MTTTSETVTVAGFGHSTAPTQQDVGHDIRTNALIRSHLQLLRVLHTLGEADQYFSDIDHGNDQPFHKAKDTLLLIDFGNVQRGLSSGTNASTSNLEALIDGAKDDAKSASSLFLPTCSQTAAGGVVTWHESLRGLKLYALLQSITSPLSHVGRGDLTDLTLFLHDVVVHRHCYIDDLETVQWLFVWLAAQERDRVINNGVSLEDILRDVSRKRHYWMIQLGWKSLLAVYCGHMPLRWHTLMWALRETIRSAQVELRTALTRRFYEGVRMEGLERSLRRLRREDPSRDVEKTVKEVFYQESRLPKTRRMEDVETLCFESCAALLQAAADEMSGDSEEQGTSSNGAGQDQEAERQIEAKGRRRQTEEEEHPEGRKRKHAGAKKE